MVVEQHAECGLGKQGCVVIELFHSAKTMCHNDSRRATAHLVRKARRTVPSSVVNSMSRFIVITFAEERFGPRGLGIGAPSDVGNGFGGSGLNGIVIAPRASKSWREKPNARGERRW